MNRWVGQHLSPELLANLMLINLNIPHFISRIASIFIQDYIIVVPHRLDIDRWIEHIRAHIDEITGKLHSQETRVNKIAYFRVTVCWKIFLP